MNPTSNRAVHARRITCVRSVLRVLVPLALVAGFGTPGEALAAPTQATPAAGDAPRTFVWTTRSEDDSPVTHVLSEDGKVITTLPGVRIAAAGTLWTWEENTEDVPTSACEDEPERPAGEGRGTRVLLVPADGWHDPLAIVVPPGADDEAADGGEQTFANEITHSARPLASVGPYLFVEESTYADTCGAHGNTAVSFETWDIEGARTVDLLSDLPDRKLVVAAGRTAIDDDPDSTADFSDDTDPAMLTELWPRLGAKGRLEATALVTVPSCYACTQGGWSSYTVSMPVPTALPPRLAAMGSVPRAVTAFADHHPELTIGGYSVESR